jgi:tRNA (cytidine/uridine-2'-O-)-methyltransferase
MQLAIFQPDIPQNTGAIIRLCACMGARLHIVEPCGFAYDDKKMRRAVMDYYDLAAIVRHSSWQAFLAARPYGRLLLLSSHASQPYTEFAYANDDMLLLGRESAGVPDEVKNAADARLTIPMQNGARSLNVAIAAGIVLVESLRQTRK